MLPCCHLVSRTNGILKSVEELDRTHDYISQHKDKFNGFVLQFITEEYQKRIQQEISFLAFNSIEALGEVPIPCQDCLQNIETLKTEFLQLGLKAYTIYNYEERK